MQIIDGKKVSEKIRQELKLEIDEFKSSGGEIGLAVVLIGSDAASQVYVRNKIRACEQLGIKSYANYLPENCTQSQVEELVSVLANDDKVSGILVQLPLPKHLDEASILKLIPEKKDVDGFSPQNMGKLVMGQDGLFPCTPSGVMQLFKHCQIETCGKRAVVLGRSNIVGKPMAAFLLNANATVTVCHSKTERLSEVLRQADIIVAAVGRANFVTADMVKDGAVVIDVGINRVDNKLVGDVDFESVSKKASFITPVPGGVGPMTITMLMSNVLKAAKGQ